MATHAVLFDVFKPTEQDDEDTPANATRFVRYHFPPEFLKLSTVGAT